MKTIFPKVVFDPGHGGPDYGAIGSYFTDEHNEVVVFEKEITLDIAKYVRRYILQKQLPLIPFLSRKEDKSMSLEDRCVKANNIIIESKDRDYIQKADLFVSIHNNAREMKGKFGIELEAYYYLGSSVGRKVSEIILEAIIRKLENANLHMPIYNRGVKIGERRSKKDGKMKPFYVLKYTHMPATLLELGFISDNEEAKFLDGERNQKILAMGIAEGVVDYFKMENI